MDVATVLYTERSNASPHKPMLRKTSEEYCINVMPKIRQTFTLVARVSIIPKMVLHGHFITIVTVVNVDILSGHSLGNIQDRPL